MVKESEVFVSMFWHKARLFELSAILHHNTNSTNEISQEKGIKDIWIANEEITYTYLWIIRLST